MSGMSLVERNERILQQAEESLTNSVESKAAKQEVADAELAVQKAKLRLAETRNPQDPELRDLRIEVARSEWNSSMCNVNRLMSENASNEVLVHAQQQLEISKKYYERLLNITRKCLIVFNFVSALLNFCPLCL